MAAKNILTAIVYLGLVFPVVAADKNGQYFVRATEKVESCQGLTRAASKARNDNDWGDFYGYSLYTMGYLTAINRVAYDTYDIAGHKNGKNVMRWLETYCADHPLDDFEFALFKLTVELYPLRAVGAPE